MNASHFLRTVLDAFYARIHVLEDDNYDARRYSADGVDRSRAFEAHVHAAYLQFFVENHAQFFQTWLLLKDDGSRNLFVRVILYRLLGHLHARIHPDQGGTSESRLYARARELVTGPGRVAASGPFGPLEHFSEVDHDGQRLDLDCWDANVVYTFLKRQYQYAVGDVRVSVRSGDVVLDAGACFGDTAVAFACAAGPRGHVFTFDPLPTHVQVSRHNAAINGLEARVSVFPFAVGRRSADLDNIVATDDGIAPGFSVHGTTASIPTISIDDFVQARQLGRVDFIKMDIEGSELAALQGAAATLRRYRPRLAISLYHRPEDFITIPAFLAATVPEYEFYLDHYTIHREETVLFARPRGG